MHATRRAFVRAVGLGGAAALTSCLARRAEATARARPSIVVILCDDMGFSDLGCYGGEIRTPNLDALAARGLRFTQFYNTGRCCPTRASILTGLYPHQASVGHMVSDSGLDGYRGDLGRDCATIAEALRPAGYATCAVGKWHVTKHANPEGPKDNWPLQRGFDRFYGTIAGGGSFYDPGTLTRDNTMISPFADPEYTPETFYYTDAISDHAARFIDEHCRAGPEQPFFMYAAYTAAHWPMHALPEDIAKYKGMYDAGYGPVRARRFARAKELGLIDPAWELSPQAGDWEKCPHKEWEARCMEVYAAMIDRMDAGIGRIVAALARNGRLENTLIMFLQDNGGCQEDVGRAGTWKRPVEPSLPPIPRDAIRLDVRPKQNRAGVPTLAGPGIMPGPEDTYIAYGLNWANVSNTPFREYKHFVHEGGIATPLIAHWPNGIARGGEKEHQPGHLIDIMATCVDVAGARYPAEVGERRIQPPEGRSLRPAFEGRTIERDALYWEHEGNRALRAGKWKLVAKGPEGAWELYDMEKDRTELHDLAAVHPEKTRELVEKWEAWARRAHAVPWPWAGTYAGKKERVGSDAKVFALKAGDRLPREKCPNLAGAAFSVSATFAGAGDGVIVAQGGSSHGFALYVRGGKLEYALRRKGALSTLASPDPLPQGEIEAVVRQGKDGAAEMRIGSRVAAAEKFPGTLAAMPLDGLEVGRDAGGLVGRYGEENAFPGTIRSVTIARE
ncbi:MAG TPA: arylsulfatase [Planctomycetes bacterium]|nr:arylsulfatase [Planctomycetota bacterium]